MSKFKRIRAKVEHTKALSSVGFTCSKLLYKRCVTKSFLYYANLGFYSFFEKCTTMYFFNLCLIKNSRVLSYHQTFFLEVTEGPLENLDFVRGTLLTWTLKPYNLPKLTSTR